MARSTAWRAALAIAGVVLLSAALVLVPGTAQVLSVTPQTGIDGDSAFKARLVSLEYETAPGSGTYAHVLLCFYGDAPDPLRLAWDYDGVHHPARDLFVTRSLDGGQSWSTPVNISQSAGLSSLTAHDDADPWTPRVDFPGDCGMPQVFGTPQTGKAVVLAWASAYAPGGEQRRAVYPESGYVEVPYRALWTAVSLDAGVTWTVRQMTTGARDVAQESVKGTGAGAGIIWQEDPRGLQPGEAEGPGDGGSGAKTSDGTDVWYTAATKAQYAAGFPAPVRVTDNFTFRDGAGLESGLRAASRPQLAVVGSTAVIAYEESKALGQQNRGKVVRYHTASPYHQLATSETGVEGHPYGLAADATRGQGWILSDPLQHARRVRVVTQGTPGPLTGLLAIILWREGAEAQGAPADIMGRIGRLQAADVGSTGLRPEDLRPSLAFASTGSYPLPDDFGAAEGNAPALNLSTRAPGGTAAATQDDALENARAHRGVIDGDFAAIGYTWTWDGVLADTTRLANHNYYLRRSFDGGDSWDGPRNLSNLPDTTTSVREPRLVKPHKPADPAAAYDRNVLVAAWGTELTQDAYLGKTTINLDIHLTRTRDQGGAWEPTVGLSNSPFADEDEESQLAVESDGRTVHAVWMQHDAAGRTDVLYSRSLETWVDDPPPVPDERRSRCGLVGWEAAAIVVILALGRMRSQRKERAP